MQITKVKTIRIPNLGEKIPSSKIEDDGKWIRCVTNDFAHGREALRKYLATHEHKGRRISLLMAGR